MQRGTSLAFALLFAAATAVVVLQTRAPKPGAAPAPSASAEPAPSPTPSAEPPSGPPGPLDLDAGAARSDDAGDGVELPPGAPKNVGFGVVLVTYAGVQFAPERARTKTEAKRLATELLETAKSDFAAAVKKGDRGSTEDAGHIPRGVLEPAIEKALFTLGKGEVHGEPLDTPRGYWIVRRNQ
jgi:hypothetical protein